MSEYLTPGVVVEEGTLQPGPIVGVTTANAVVFGYVGKGDMRTPILCTNWTEFQTKCGSFRSDSYIPYAAYFFFKNGGTRFYVVRLCANASPGVFTDDPALASVTLKDGSSVATLKVSAKSKGLWGNSISMDIATGTLLPSTEFKITVKNTVGGVASIVEVWDNLSMVTTAENYVETVINGSSDWIVVDDQDSVTAAPGDRPAVETARFIGAAGSPALTFVAGTDGSVPVTADYVFSYANSLQDNLLIATPGVVTAAIVQAGADYCASRGDSVFVQELAFNTARDAAKAARLALSMTDGSYSAMYYPWVLCSDPNGVGKNPVKYLPPSCFVLGLICRTDLAIGPWKAPAGGNSVLSGAIGLEFSIQDVDQAILNPVGINCIRIFSGSGIVVWGARTLASNSKYRYLNVRRLTNYVKSSFKTSFAWSVFEINDSYLWNSLTRLGNAFLKELWTLRALYGPSPDKAYFIKCDEELNTSTSIDLGQVKYQVGIRPSKPAEVVIITISQWDGGVSVTE